MSTASTSTSDATSPLLADLDAFFSSDPERLELMKECVETNHPQRTISIRLLDSFVTKFAHATKLVIVQKNGENFDVYRSYQEQLRIFKKTGFDWFKRNAPIIPYKTITKTTLPQLNAFRWMIQNGIIEYAKAHKDEIEKHVSLSNNTKLAGKRLSGTPPKDDDDDGTPQKKPRPSPNNKKPSPQLKITMNSGT